MHPSKAVLLSLALAPLLAAAQGEQLTEVYKNNDFQLTGVTVSKSGRMFVNFPRWSDKYVNAVVEVMKDGSTKPYPDSNWNIWDMKPASAGDHFVCVQSVVADDTDALWVIDPAAPLLASIVPGGPKLVRIDLATNKITNVYHFGPDTAKTNSYLNDIRIDTNRKFVYMTDSGAGGILVVDLNTGVAHRALDGDPSVMAEKGIQIRVNGKPVIGPNGKPPQFNSDGIALSHDGEYLYYKPLTGAMLYRIKTDLLRNPSAMSATVQCRGRKSGQDVPVRWSMDGCSRPDLHRQHQREHHISHRERQDGEAGVRLEDGVAGYVFRGARRNDLHHRFAHQRWTSVQPR